MIGGLAPVIVFTFPNIKILGNLGVPAIFPVYLDENLTGVAADGADESVRIETQAYKDITYQRKIGQTISLKMRISKNNIIGSTLLSLMAKIYELIDSGEVTIDPITQTPNLDYFVSVYYDSSFMLKGYLGNYEKNTVQDTNQYEIKMTFVSIPTKSVIRKVLSAVDNAISILPRG